MYAEYILARDSLENWKEEKEEGDTVQVYILKAHFKVRLITDQLEPSCASYIHIISMFSIIVLNN